VANFGTSSLEISLPEPGHGPKFDVNLVLAWLVHQTSLFIADLGMFSEGFAMPVGFYSLLKRSKQVTKGVTEFRNRYKAQVSPLFGLTLYLFLRMEVAILFDPNVKWDKQGVTAFRTEFRAFIDAIADFTGRWEANSGDHENIFRTLERRANEAVLHFLIII
jgi:hypothetical protein